MPRRNNGPRLRFLDKRGCYYICWTEGGRSRERSTGTGDRGAAEVAFASFLQERIRRTGGPRDPAEILVSEVLANYAEEHGPQVEHPARIGHALEALAPFWADKTVADVGQRSCVAYVEHRAPRKASTVRRELGVLGAAINWAWKNGALTRPAAVWRPPEGPAKDTWMTRSEAARLLREALRGRARLYLPLFILISLYTGRRMSAVLELRWHQVNLTEGTIDFRRPGQAENNKRRGVVRIPARLVAHLRRARLRGVDLGYVIHAGEHARLRDIGNGFDLARDRAGLSRKVTPHTIKHTCASWIAQDGVPIWTAAQYLSTSVATLEKVYAHHDPNRFDDVHQALARRPQNVRATSGRKARFADVSAR